MTPLFEAALGTRWQALAPEVRAMHDLTGRHTSRGRAAIARGRHPLARLIAWAFGFPTAGKDVPVTVTMERTGSAEIWTRDFGGARFTSTLTPATPGHVHERLGPIRFFIELTEVSGGFGMAVRGAYVVGLPIPRVLLPSSETSETEEDGRFRFDVRLSVPVAGLLVHYRGWLVRD